MKIPAGAFSRDCMVDVNKAVEGCVGNLSNRDKDKKPTALSVKVSTAAAKIPNNGVHIKIFPEMKDAEKKPTSAFERIFGPSSDADRLSSRAPMSTPDSSPFVLP